MTEMDPAAKRPPSYIHNNSKEDHLKRLRRIEGQARGLQRMVEEEQYCIDILTQVSAMTKALRSVALACSTSTWRTASSTPPARATMRLTSSSRRRPTQLPGWFGPRTAGRRPT